MFRVAFFYIGGVLFHVDWCIRKSTASYLFLSQPTVAPASHIAIILTWHSPFNLPNSLYSSIPLYSDCGYWAEIKMPVTSFFNVQPAPAS